MIRRSRSLAPLVFLLAAAAPAGAQDVLAGDTCVDFRGVSRMHPDTLIAIGDRMLEEWTRDRGVVKNPVWTERVEAVVDRLAESVDPALDFDPVVLDSDDWNAVAVPNGSVVVFRGILEWMDRLAAAEEPDDPVAREERARTYLAVVLGHEIAHHTMGHLGPAYRMYAASLDDDRFEEERAFDPEMVEVAGYSRGCETQADRAGGLYLLWSGWEIQDAIDLWTVMDREERRDPDFAHVLNSTFARSHPRGSNRISELNILRGELMRNQARYDDARALIDFNVQLDDAVALLDQVLSDFPHLVPARHARATALHRQWLNTVPIQVQQLRADLITLDAHFLPDIKEMAPGDTALLERAVADYRDVLTAMPLPQTRSHLALLLAYDGDLDGALELSREALAAAPEDPGVLNNHGVILFLAGNREEARERFVEALEIDDWQRHPVTLFNLGKTLAILREPGAEEALYHYLELGDGSQWGVEAEEILDAVTGGGTVRPPKPATRGGDPVAAGVWLDASAEEVVAALGEPGTRAGTLWDYGDRGIVVVFDEGETVQAVVLFEPTSGEVMGVRPGMLVEDALDLLGSAAHRDGNLRFFAMDGWEVVIREVAGEVAEVGIRR